MIEYAILIVMVLFAMVLRGCGSSSKRKSERDFGKRRSNQDEVITWQAEFIGRCTSTADCSSLKRGENVVQAHQLLSRKPLALTRCGLRGTAPCESPVPSSKA